MSEHHVHIDANPKRVDLQLRDVWRYRDFVWSYTRTYFAKKYKQTVLGPLWLLINPMINALMNLFVFGMIAGIGTNGIPMLLFYLGGQGIWSYLASIITASSFTFSANAHLYGKVWFPRLCIPVSYIITSAAEYLIQLVPFLLCALYYALTGAFMIRWSGLLLSLLLLPWLGALGLGVGILISSMTTKYRDLGLLVSLGVRFWMYATPVVYPLSEVRNSFLQKWIRLNPVTAVVELFRRFLFGVGEVSPGMIAYSLIVTALILTAGIFSFNRIERSFMDTV